MTPNDPWLIFAMIFVQMMNVYLNFELLFFTIWLNAYLQDIKGVWLR